MPYLNKRPFNFSAGPAVMPESVLQKAADEICNWHASGMSVMEMSHRGKDFGQIFEKTQLDLQKILDIPNNFKILFLQGGAITQNAVIPLNLSQGKGTDFVVTGGWSQKSFEEAKKYSDAHLAASNAVANSPLNHTTMPNPSTWQLRTDSAYVHICSNETVFGVEFDELPDLKALGCDVPLVIDFSSHVATRPIDWSRVGLAFGGAQKNLGASGLTVVIVREDLLGKTLTTCPSAFDYQRIVDNDGMYNTPCTWGIYIAGLVFEWILEQGGILEMQRRAIERSSLLYNAIDNSILFENRVHPRCRSRVNIPFHLKNTSLNELFLQGAQAQGLLGLKGHKSAGGMRASLYNAMPLEGVQALVQYLKAFDTQHA